MEKRIFIVPHDFTDAGDIALKQAIIISKQTQAEIALVHIINKKDELNTAEAKLKAILDKNQKITWIKIKGHVIKGSIFSSIGKFAESINATAIIMGTHGSVGMQKVFGSFAIKVLISTHIPFMIVQKNTELKNIKKILFSINPTSESLQIMSFVVNIAQIFKTEVHIIAEKTFDKKHAMKIKNNLKVISKHLKLNNIIFHLDLIDSKKSWDESIFDYAQKINADLFAYSYDSDRFLASNNKFTQSIIFNKLNLPTIIINSKSIFNLYF